MNEEKIFLGNTPARARAYLLSTLQRFKGKKIIIPCCGQFAMAFCAVQAGISPADIKTSDVSLFTTILGYHLTGQSLDPLEIKFDGQPFQGTTPELLYQVKLYMMRAQARHYFQEVYVTDLVERKEAHIAHLAETLKSFDALKGLTYSMADMHDEIAAAVDGADNIIWVNPPGFAKGYIRMYSTGGRLTWAEPQYKEFKPQDGHNALREFVKDKAALVIWYRPGEMAKEDEPYGVFTHQRNGKTWGYVMCNRPADFTLSSHAKKHDDRARGLAVLASDYEITANSQLNFIRATSEDALYYRDLFIHKMGSTHGSKDYLMIIDGFVAGAVGFSGVRKLTIDPFEAHFEEVYGICAPSIRHPKIGRLLMMSIKCNEFQARFLDTLQFHSLGIITTCLSIHPEMKQHRGQYKLILREKLKDGTFRLRYQGDRTKLTLKGVLNEWLKKYSSAKDSNSGE